MPLIVITLKCGLQGMSKVASELLACVSLELLEHFVVDLLNVPAMPTGAADQIVSA